MSYRPPTATRTDTLCPATTHIQSVRVGGFDVVAPVKEVQLPAPVRLPAATQVDDVGERAVLVLRTVVVRVEKVALAIARGQRADHADAVVAGELVGEFE